MDRGRRHSAVDRDSVERRSRRFNNDPIRSATAHMMLRNTQ